MSAAAAVQPATIVGSQHHRARTYGPGVVMTRTPLRVSLAGGGTDLAEFYTRDYGAVFSTAIDKYVYVTVKRHSELFYEPIRINYSKTEQTERIEDIQNNIARECLKFLNIEPPIYISTVADVPASTGLGGSSSFTVGLLHALHAYRGERVSAGQLAEEACYIEIDVLREPIGKQDQYAAAFGGVNYFRFNKGGSVSVESQCFLTRGLSRLFDYVMMFWTDMQRDTSTVLSEQNRNTSANNDTLCAMRDHAEQLRSFALAGDPDPADFGRVLDQTWQLKRTLANKITNSKIDDWYERAKRAGAEGGKLCGAGGGGFLLMIVRPENQEAVRQALSELMLIPVLPDSRGSMLLLPSGS